MPTKKSTNQIVFTTMKKEKIALPFATAGLFIFYTFRFSVNFKHIYIHVATFQPQRLEELLQKKVADINPKKVIYQNVEKFSIKV